MVQNSVADLRWCVCVCVCLCVESQMDVRKRCSGVIPSRVVQDHKVSQGLQDTFFMQGVQNSA